MSPMSRKKQFLYLVSPVTENFQIKFISLCDNEAKSQKYEGDILIGVVQISYLYMTHGIEPSS